MEKPCSWITTSPESAIFFVHPKHPQETHWTSGQPCLSLLRPMSTHHQAWTTLLQPSSRATAYVESTSRSMRIGNWNKSWPRCRCHSRSWWICGSFQTVKRCQPFPFPIRSWVDLPHVCDSSRWMAFYFRECQICFHLPITLSTFRSTIFPIPDTFHPKRWSLSSPRCPTSKDLNFNSDRLSLALTGKPDVRLHQIVLSFPPSILFISKVSSNI